MNQIKLAAVFLFLSSCVEVGFRHPMPPKGKTLEIIPTEIIAYYKSLENDSSTVGINLGDISNEMDLNEPLSSNTVLKYWKGNYYLNLKEDSLWQIFIIKPVSKGDFRTYQLDGGEAETLETLKKITTVKEVYDKNGKLDLIILDPTFKEFKKIIKSGAFERIELFDN